MTTKANKSWATATKAQLNTVTVDDGLKSVGNSYEPIVAYYSLTQPKSGNTNSRLLEEGAEINGTYEGSFTGKKFGKKTHKVRTNEGLIGLPGSGQLDKLMGLVKQGATVKVIYQGKKEISSGQYAGKPAHVFIVRASEMI